MKNVENFTPGEYVADIPEDAFASTVYKNAILKVPEGSLANYAQKEGWKKFYFKTDGTKLLGDLSGDGKKIDGSDLKLLRKMIVGNIATNTVADLNGDGLVNGADLKIMRRIIVKTY